MVNNQEINQPAAIKIANVSVYLGDVRVLENISFTIEHGVMVALVGPNGAGKSTLFRAILGLVPIAGGEILIHGLPFSEIRGEMAYVPQSEQINWLFPLTSLDVVMLGRQRKIGWFRKPSRLDKEVVRYSLDRVGLYDKRNSLVTELSGGQRQRLFVARALAQEAHTLLLDEAFSGVDIASQEGLMDILNSLKNEGKTILLSTHDLTNMSERFDLCCCLNKHICAFGKPDEAFTPEVLEELYGSHSSMKLDSDGG